MNSDLVTQIFYLCDVSLPPTFWKNSNQSFSLEIEYISNIYLFSGKCLCTLIIGYFKLKLGKPCCRTIVKENNGRKKFSRFKWNKFLFLIITYVFKVYSLILYFRYFKIQFLRDSKLILKHFIYVQMKISANIRVSRSSGEKSNELKVLYGPFKLFTSSSDFYK